MCCANHQRPSLIAVCETQKAQVLKKVGFAVGDPVRLLHKANTISAAPKGFLPHMLIRKNLLRVGALIAISGLAFWGMNLLFSWAASQGNTLGLPLRLAVLAVYALLICVPFLPSFHLSLAFMILQGPDQIWWIFWATVVGFLLPFVAGNRIPHRHLVHIFNDLHMYRIAKLVKDTHAIPRDQRSELITQMAPKWIKPLVNKWRYLAIAIALNVPGNVIIGGAGGILMVAGLSRLFAPAAILVTIIVCLCPIPILISVTDFDVLAWLRS